MPRTWNDVYREFPPEQIPWEAGKPDRHLVALVKGMRPGRALDICCGTGNDAIFLAQRGWDVAAVDISETAIEMAKEKARKAHVEIDFRVGSVPNLPFPDSTFDLVNDRGCFHHLILVDMKGFLAGILRVLKKGGIYNLMAMSSDEEHVTGPHKFRKAELAGIFSPYFEIKKIAKTRFEGPGQPGARSAPYGPKAWHAVMEKK